MIRTGMLMVDILLGGGLRRGKIIEIFGSESCGKSTIVQSIVSKASDRINVSYYDMEGSVDQIRLHMLGIHNIKIHSPMYLEEFVGNAMKDLESGMLVVWDTLASTIPKEQSGLQKRPQMVKDFLIRAKHTDGILIILNQVYDLIGVPGVASPGGRGVRHMSDIRVKMARTGVVESNGNVIGIEGTMKTVKSRLSVEGLEMPYYISIDYGYDDIRSVLLFLMKYIVSKGSGGYKTLQFKDKQYKWQTYNQFAEMYSDAEFRNIVRYLVLRHIVSLSTTMKIKFYDEYRDACLSVGEDVIALTDEEERLLNVWKSQVGN